MATELDDTPLGHSFEIAYARMTSPGRTLEADVMAMIFADFGLKDELFELIDARLVAAFMAAGDYDFDSEDFSEEENEAHVRQVMAGMGAEMLLTGLIHGRDIGKRESSVD